MFDRYIMIDNHREFYIIIRLERRKKYNSKNKIIIT